MSVIFRDGDPLLLKMWRNWLIAKAHIGAEMSIPIRVLSRYPNVARDMQIVGHSIEQTMATPWVVTDMSPASRGVLTKCLARGLECKTLNDLARLRNYGRVSGIGPKTANEIDRVISEAIKFAVRIALLRNDNG